MWLQVLTPRYYERTGLSVRCHAGTATQPAESTGTSKCPVMRVVNGTKSLISAAAPALDAAQRFSHDVFNYTPFSAPNYQVRTIFSGRSRRCRKRVHRMVHVCDVVRLT
jgi:hypothetical protein